MTPHPTEMLSALVDGELAEVDRARVEAHVASCAECATHLRELRALDGFARDLGPATAPARYHEDFAARLRPRLRSGRGGAPRLARPWLWPVAAAVALAVVAPLVLREQHEKTARVVAVATPPSLQAREYEAAPPAAAPPASPADMGATAATDAVRPAENTVLQRANPGAGSLARSPRGQEAEPQDAAPRSKAAGGFAAAPPAQPPSTAEANEADTYSAGVEGGAVGEAKATLGTTPDRKEERARATGALADRRDGPVALAKKDKTFARPADARAARESLRRSAPAEPDGARADDARVRMIEAGVEAYRLGGDDADRALALRDADAYLARADARQADRVRAAIRRLDDRR